MGAEILGLAPQSIVVFEDSVAGIEAARRGGFRSVGIGNPKILGGAEMVIDGLDQHRPVEIINKLNF
jgi:beta-phosphoglucomutase